MLIQRLIHPQILSALAAAGHGSRILITDANYPAKTKVGKNAKLVYLNLVPGTPDVPEVLEALITAIPIEDAAVMQPESGPDPEIFAEFQKRLPELELIRLQRFDFYDEASKDDTCLQIVTGEQRIYANLLITIGVVMP